MVSSIVVNLCFCDFSLIPLTFNWNVAGIDVFIVLLAELSVVYLGTVGSMCC